MICETEQNDHRDVFTYRSLVTQALFGHLILTMENTGFLINDCINDTLKYQESS